MTSVLPAEDEDSELAEFEQLQRKAERHEALTWTDRAKLSFERFITRYWLCIIGGSKKKNLPSASFFF